MKITERIDKRIFEAELTPKEKKNLKKVLKEDVRPSEGIWWFIWLKPQWIYLPFLTTEYGDTLHDDIWAKYVVNKIAQHYKIYNTEPLKDAYTCMPRGRIAKRMNNKWGVYHGGDSPVSEDKLKNKVISSFNLVGPALNKQVEFMFDEHERMLIDDQKVFFKLTGEKPWRKI